MILAIVLACSSPAVHDAGAAKTHTPSDESAASAGALVNGSWSRPIVDALGLPATPVVEIPSTGPEMPLVAELSADVVEGSFPLRVSFDAGGSELGKRHITFSWSFGDGLALEGDAIAEHSYVGQGAFTATLTLVDTVTGEQSVAHVEINVSTPPCPVADVPVQWGTVQDGALTELSGIAESPRVPGVWWVQQDSGNSPDLTVIDASGATLSTQDIDDDLVDFEDIEASVDPVTGVSTLFLADIGDNSYDRGEVAVWVVSEPDPLLDGALTPLRMGLTYPEGSRNAETLLVDPVTFDLYIVTKESWGEASIYVKRAPHDSAGPFVLEALGTRSSLDLVATAGDVSADGSRVVVRDYTETARLWFRDGYQPLESAFDVPACEVEIHGEQQGEAIAFTADGGGLVTVSEGGGSPVYYIGI